MRMSAYSCLSALYTTVFTGGTKTLVLGTNETDGGVAKMVAYYMSDFRTLQHPSRCCMLRAAYLTMFEDRGIEASAEKSISHSACVYWKMFAGKRKKNSEKK